jgi:hypothetical protein
MVRTRLVEKRGSGMAKTDRQPFVAYGYELHEDDLVMVDGVPQGQDEIEVEAGVMYDVQRLVSALPPPSGVPVADPDDIREL